MRRRLVLMRHAKSSWDHQSLWDHDRPLAARGLRDAPRMGERLAARGIRPDLLLTSTAERARQTAALIEPAFAPSTPLTQADNRIYLASPGGLLGVIAEVDSPYRELILIGHNPGLTVLANRLLPDLGLSNLPTAGTVAIDCELDDWHEIDSARLSLAFYDYPKNRAAPG